MTPNNRAFALAALLLSLAVPRVGATLSKAATFDEKVDRAAAIVLGHAVKKESHWDADHRFILTYTTFRIEKSFKGLSGQQEITVVTPGGEVGGVHQETVGIPAFVEGRDAVVFIRNSSAGPTVLYFDQGAYDVEKDGNERVVRPVTTGAVQIDTQRGIAVPSEEPRTLLQFERAVRDSEGRIQANRMELIKRQQQAQAPSATSVLIRYKYFLLLALVGAALATWQLLRR
ncbi:MAG TPA: hypothetical protein VF980_03585 [Thermoanaerobaculia bacterium]